LGSGALVSSHPSNGHNCGLRMAMRSKHLCARGFERSSVRASRIRSGGRSPNSLPRSPERPTGTSLTDLRRSKKKFWAPVLDRDTARLEGLLESLRPEELATLLGRRRFEALHRLVTGKSSDRFSDDLVPRYAVALDGPRLLDNPAILSALLLR